MKKLGAQNILLLLCVGVSLAQDTSAQLKNIEERLRATEQTLEELKRENEALRIFTKASSDKFESFQAENKAKEIAFSVGLMAPGSGSKQVGPLETRTRLVYKKIFTNIGNAYNSNDGVFTAPVAGVYFFRFYAHAHSMKQMSVSLHKNGEIQCSVYAEKPQSNANGSNGVVLSLEKGDQVCTQLWMNSWVFDDESSYTSFSGFLLFTL